MTNQYQYLLKFIVIGDTSVGKSSVVLQFTEQTINASHDVTIGVEFASRIVTIKGKTIKFQVWDTAGQQNFRSITRSYYRSAIGAFLIYDITKRRTFEHLQDWIKQIRNYGGNQLQILLIGNKTDLQSQREVSSEEGKTFADNNGLQWMEMSAKQYNNVEAAFAKLAMGIIKRIDSGQIAQHTPGIKICEKIEINPLNRNSKQGCC